MKTPGRKRMDRSSYVERVAAQVNVGDRVYMWGREGVVIDKKAVGISVHFVVSVSNNTGTKTYVRKSYNPVRVMLPA